MTKSNVKKVFDLILMNAFMIVSLIIIFIPLVVVLSASLRSPVNQTNPLFLFKEVTLETYIKAFGRMKYFRTLLNSIILTFSTLGLLLVFNSMAGYFLARMKNMMSSVLSSYFLAGLIIPAQLAFIPIYKVMHIFGLKDSMAAPIILWLACSIPFSTFLFTGFIRSSVPFELEESAEIDGCSSLRRFWQIVFPLLIPVTVATAIIQGVNIWNDFFTPMLFITDVNKKPLNLFLLNYLGDKENPAQWNMLFASCYLVALPLIALFALLQKYFISGLAAGAVKG